MMIKTHQIIRLKVIFSLVKGNKLIENKLLNIQNNPLTLCYLSGNVVAAIRMAGSLMVSSLRPTTRLTVLNLNYFRP